MTDPAETNAEPSDKRSLHDLKKDGRFNRLFSLAAIVLSFVAILVSVMEVSAIRTQQKASVWPYVSIGERYSGQGFRLELRNKGVGPALMGKVEIYHDGKPVTDIDALIAETVGPERAFSFDVYGLSDPSSAVVSSGEYIDLFSVPWEDRTRLLVERWSGSIDVRTCYCSIYGDCWQVSLKSLANTPTDTCAGAPLP